MQRRHRYAVAGAALLTPIAAMFWLDLLRGRPLSPGLAVVSAASAASAALASPGHPLRAGLLAAIGAATSGLALDRYVAWLESIA